LRVIQLSVDLFALNGSSRFCKVEVSLSMNEASMDKTRLEAFSDGVIAIIITIMALELKVPHGDNLFKN
jgi:hypothetical protein